MYKKITKIIGTIMIVVALCSLFFPIYRTNKESGEGWLIILKGLDVVRFSACGGLVIIIPLMMLGIVYSEFKDKLKMIFIMFLYAASTISLYIANIDTRGWIYGQATGFVREYGTFACYAGSLFISALMFYFHYNINENDACYADGDIS